MRAQVLKYWDRVRSSFWFLPSLMAATAVGLSFITVAIDQSATQKWLRRLNWVYSGGTEGASAVLQTIAGSMITIAGVVFSLTLVALSLASSQFGPRMLRNFMRDTANQLVLGTFIATFLYCLLVLRTIRREEGDVFVPHLSVTLGLFFALASLWVLIYFIHHVSISIQADEVIARVGAELDETMDRVFPAHLGKDADEPVDLAPRPDDPPPPMVTSGSDGYLQIIDVETLMNFARNTGTVLRLLQRPGQYVVQGMPLLHAVPAEQVPEDMQQRLQGAFVLGNQRTAAQDVEFAILQLVEIATRALSPGINDPFTAIACIDRPGVRVLPAGATTLPGPVPLRRAAVKDHRQAAYFFRVGGRGVQSATQLRAVQRRGYCSPAGVNSGRRQRSDPPGRPRCAGTARRHDCTRLSRSVDRRGRQTYGQCPSPRGKANAF